MNTISNFIKIAEKDGAVWISHVAKAFDEDAKSHPLILRLVDLNGEKRDYSCPIVQFENEDERSFLLDYLSARIFNILSVYSGREVQAFCNTQEAWLKVLLEDCFTRFFTESGYKKVINIAKRLSGETPAFSVLPIENNSAQAKEKQKRACNMTERIKKAVARSEKGSYCGIDVGGTDIKLAVAVNGKLVEVKEYDWNPSLCHDAQSIKSPIIMLTRLMAACAVNAENAFPLDMSRALKKDASDEEMESAVSEAVKRFGSFPKFNGIGLSFPDIVINNRILGGETPKTIGIRNDPEKDYEAELIVLSELTEDLKDYSEDVCAVNDGSMSAFSCFCELGFADAPQAGEAMLAHSLGTDLGTGWIDGEGRVPPFPMECYDLLFDMGSRKSKLLPTKDLRSLKNENSNMAGARRYLGQAAVYRLVYMQKPELLEDFICICDGKPMLRLSPVDMRKSCLAHIMKLASQGDKVCEQAFRQIGINLGQISREIVYITHVDIDTRSLFGRFVKERRCFELICEGFSSVMPEVKLVAADEDMAFTPLMRQLSMREDVTVAQFAQAVSGLYYGSYQASNFTN